MLGDQEGRRGAGGLDRVVAEVGGSWRGKPILLWAEFQSGQRTCPRPHRAGLSGFVMTARSGWPTLSGLRARVKWGVRTVCYPHSALLLAGDGSQRTSEPTYSSDRSFYRPCLGEAPPPQTHQGGSDPAAAGRGRGKGRGMRMGSRGGEGD